MKYTWINILFTILFLCFAGTVNANASVSGAEDNMQKKNITEVTTPEAIDYNVQYQGTAEDSSKNNTENKTTGSAIEIKGEKAVEVTSKNNSEDFLTVANAGETEAVVLRRSPDPSADKVGVVYGSLQEICILDKLDNYYKVRVIPYGESRYRICYIRADMIKQAKINKTYRVVVSLRHQWMTIYKGDVLFKKFKCSTGKPGTPTPPGRYLIGARGKRFYTDNNLMVYDWVRFNNHYKIHSLLMDLKGNPVKSSAHNLGYKASHGCIRLGFDDAKWFYTNIPKSTLLEVSQTE